MSCTNADVPSAAADLSVAPEVENPTPADPVRTHPTALPVAEARPPRRARISALGVLTTFVATLAAEVCPRAQADNLCP